MKVAIDLDGVCYEWDRTARYMLREYRGQAQLTGSSQSWNDIQESVSEEDWKWLWSHGVQSGLFRYGHMVKGCRVGLEALVRASHELVVVTHRPNTAVNDTLEWMGLYFKNIPLSGFHLMTNMEPKTSVEWDVLVDDKPENVEDAINHARRAILFDRQHNRHYETKTRARGWPEVVEILNG